jgi:hypothetical protein
MSSTSHRRDALPRAPMLRLISSTCTAALLLAHISSAAPLPGTKPLENHDDLSVQMVAGIGRYLDRETAKARVERLEKAKTRDTKVWLTMLLRARLGMSDTPATGGIEVVQALDAKPVESPEAGYRALHVRWPVFNAVWGEGLLLQPRGESKATVCPCSSTAAPPGPARRFSIAGPISRTASGSTGRRSRSAALSPATKCRRSSPPSTHSA